MLLDELQLDRNLRKKAAQNTQTKDAGFSSSNPVLNPQNNTSTKINNEKDATDDGAKNIITGTVITACLIQTSATPSRVELAGNDVTLYDDTTVQNGKIIGDTARIVFSHGSGKDGEIITDGFIFEKRASRFSSYDNVLSLYGLQSHEKSYDYIFIGRNATKGDEKYNVNAIVFGVNSSSVQPGSDQDAINGIFRVEWAEDGVNENANTPFLAGDSRNVFPGAGLNTGFSSFMLAGGGGATAMGYVVGTSLKVMWYILDDTNITVGANIIPDITNTYDIGSPSMKFRNIYGTPAACSLPTVENALELLDEIPEPTDIEGRGHFGDGLYFDDQTFPDSISFINSEGEKDIDLARVTGFLLKVVKELRAEVNELKSRLP